MRFTVRISFLAALEAAPFWGPAFTSDVAGTFHNSNRAAISGKAVTLMAARSNL
jgi:hypothetical protein